MRVDPFSAHPLHRKILISSLIIAGIAAGVTVSVLFGAFVFHAIGSCHAMGGEFRFDWFDCELSGDPFDFVKIVLNPQGYIVGLLIALMVGVVVFYIRMHVLLRRMLSQE